MNKTAMQELIEWIKQMPAFQYEPVVHGIYNRATELLDKEKEQIKDAWEAGEMFGERVERDGMNLQQITERRAEYLTTLS